MKFICDRKNFKTRAEKNGTYSLLNIKTGKIMFLNKTASLILEIPEINSTEELVNYLLENYDGITKEQVIKDCERLIYKMNALDIVSIIEEPTEKRNIIIVAGENDYKKLSRFFTNSLSQKGKMVFCASADPRYYSTYAIRTRQFNNQEYNIIYLDQYGCIKAAISLGCGLSSSLMTLTSVFADETEINIVKKMLSYIFNITPDLTKLRVLVKKNAMKQVENYILKLGFELEAVLKKEYGNTDLLCYSLFRD